MSKTARNIHTGDFLISRIPTEEYRENFDKVNFSKEGETSARNYKLKVNGKEVVNDIIENGIDDKGLEE